MSPSPRASAALRGPADERRGSCSGVHGGPGPWAPSTPGTALQSSFRSSCWTGCVQSLNLVTAAANGNALLGKQIASNARSWLQRSPANPAKQFKQRS